MKKLFAIAVASLSLAIANVRAAEPMPVEEAVQRDLLIRHPTPLYPYEGRRQKLEGSGLFELKFNYETGHLREVHIVHSTRKPILDQAVVDTLKLWRAKPKSVHSILLPVTLIFRN